jgi:hypothetical protein
VLRCGTSSLKTTPHVKIFHLVKCIKQSTSILFSLKFLHAIDLFYKKLILDIRVNEKHLNGDKTMNGIEIKNEELIKKVNAAIESVNGFDQYECEYEFLGIRFEDKARTVGEIIEECSKDNEDREDERDFPEYGTEEYEEMEELDGISTWNIHGWKEGNTCYYSDTVRFEASRLYLIGGNSASNGPDDNELVIEDGVVLAVII